MNDFRTEACRFIETEITFSIACDCEEEHGIITERCEECEETAKCLEARFAEIFERGARKENEAWCKSVCALCKGGDVPEPVQCVSEKSWFHGEAYCHATEVRNRLEEK
jgi:hypothetical protein